MFVFKFNVIAFCNQLYFRNMIDQIGLDPWW